MKFQKLQQVGWDKTKTLSENFKAQNIQLLWLVFLKKAFGLFRLSDNSKKNEGKLQNNRQNKSRNGTFIERQ